ncbi:hypothetical protein K456DRAFT_1747358 [Colletotrichum gloeosporioides 23]|nr:hypothetical protein K456DRAFT_1747358 [Colletotrichum gloeosporioides 23]
MTEAPDLWAKARERLPEDVQEWLSNLNVDSQQSPIGAQLIDELISEAHKKQEELEKSRHSFILKAGNHKLELRLVFENMIKWIDKFKGIGDVVSSFDPVHAALPWAAFRFVLQHLVAEQEHADKFVELLASIPRLLFTGRVFELVYTKKSMHLEESQYGNHIGLESLHYLHREIVDLYSGVLSALQFCYSFFSKSKTMRKVAAVFNSSAPAEIIGQLEEQHKKVTDRGDVCKRVSSHRFEHKYLTMLEGHQTSLGRVNDRVNRILVQIYEKERLRTLRKISEILFQAHHRTVRVKRTAGTCDWLITNTKLTRWMEGGCALVVLYAGAGKTFLTSRVVDFVVENAKRNEAVALFYCKRDEENRRNPQDIFRSILRQLSSDIVSDERKIHPLLKSLPDRLESKGMMLDVSTCKSLIGEITKDYSKITIILDALDECDRDNRWEIMATFDELVQLNPSIRIFLSSHTDDDIQRHFQSQPIIEIQATDNEEDISTFVRDELSSDPRWGQLGPDSQQQIQDAFQEKSKGMLIPWSASTIADHLERAPKGLEEAYDIVWSQIQDMPRGRNRLAERAFLWVLCAFEPLHTVELSIAMQMGPDSCKVQPHDNLGKDDILGICGNLLIHDQGTELWHFCHLSAREYVQNRDGFDIISAHCHVAISSFNFLKQNLLWKWNPPELSDDDPAGEKARYPRDYILRQTLNHAHHASSSGTRSHSLENELKEFLGSMFTGSTTFVAWRDMYMVHWWELAVEGLDKVDTGVPSPLPLAIEHGHEPIWRFLIRKSSGINTGCPLPLMVAIEVNSMAAFKALIEAGEDVNGIDPDPGRSYASMFRDNYTLKSGCDRARLRINTPLKAALASAQRKERGDLDKFGVVCELLSKGAKVNLPTKCGDTVEFAALNLSEEFFRLVLDKGPAVSNPDYVLFLAAGNEKINLSNSNMRRRIGAQDIHKRFEWNQMSALTRAVQMGHIQTVRLLLRLGARIDLTRRTDRDAVVGAAESTWGGEIITQLIMYGMDINANDGRTSLLSMGLLSVKGRDDSSSVLIRAGANPSQILSGSPLPTPLTIAAAKGLTKSFNVLLDAGADPNMSVDVGVGSALASAAFFRQVDICRALLLRKDIDLNRTQNGFYLTPFQALIRGHSESTSHRKGPFNLGIWSRFHAGKPRHLEVLKLFLENGLVVHTPLNSSLNTLCPFSDVHLAGYEVKETCLFYARQHHSSFPGAWSYIMWELLSGPRPQIPIQIRLRRWGFPGNLPLNITFVVKLAPAYKGLPLRLIVWDTCGNLPVLRAIPARQNFRYGLNMQTGRRGWVRYIPQNDSTFKGVQIYAEHAGGYAAAIKRFMSCGIFGTMAALIFLLFAWYSTQASSWLGSGVCYM